MPEQDAPTPAAATTTTTDEPRTRVSLDKAAPDVYAEYLTASKTVGAFAASAGIDRRLVELVNLRVSQINGCAFCLDLHSRAAAKAGETAQRMAILPAWRETDLFTPREKAALTLAESVTDLPESHAQDAAYATASAAFDDQELAAIIWVAITINAFNRLSILSRHPIRVRAETKA